MEHTREDFVLVEVTMFASRSRQAKRRLYQGVGPQLRQAERRLADVFIVLQEPSWRTGDIRGGQMASEVDLGFEVRV